MQCTKVEALAITRETMTLVAFGHLNRDCCLDPEVSCYQ